MKPRELDQTESMAVEDFVAQEVDGEATDSPARNARLCDDDYDNRYESAIERCEATAVLARHLKDDPDVAWAFDEVREKLHAQTAARADSRPAPWYRHPRFGLGLAAVTVVAVVAALAFPPAGRWGEPINGTSALFGDTPAVEDSAVDNFVELPASTDARPGTVGEDAIAVDSEASDGLSGTPNADFSLTMDEFIELARVGRRSPDATDQPGTSDEATSMVELLQLVRCGTDAEFLNEEIQGLEQERQRLLSRFTERHPDVIDLDRRLRELKDAQSQAASGNQSGCERIDAQSYRQRLQQLQH